MVTSTTNMEYINGIRKECKNCGQEFITMEQRKKYCCNKCKTNYHRNKLILKTA